MSEKVDGGLCASCSSGQVFECSNGGITTYCHMMGDQIRVPNDITKCTGFHGRNEPWQHDFEQIAWVIRTDNKGQRVGFEPPKKKDD